jgi:hypothetical protein
MLSIVIENKTEGVVELSIFPDFKGETKGRKRFLFSVSGPKKGNCKKVEEEE